MFLNLKACATRAYRNFPERGWILMQIRTQSLSRAVTLHASLDKLVATAVFAAPQAHLFRFVNAPLKPTERDQRDA